MSLKKFTTGFLIISAACLGFGSSVKAQDSTEDQAKLLSDIQSINQTEIKAGNLAFEKGATPDVRDFGKRLIADHKKLNIDVEKYAKDHGLTVPTSTAKELTDLESLTGKDFDKKFAEKMTKDHEDAIEMVRNVRSNVADTQFKAFLTTVINSMQKHHATAEKLEKKLSV